MRKVASATVAPVPAQAATGRRRRARAREAPPERPTGSTAPFAPVLREVSRAAAVGGDLRQALEPRQHAPPFPAAPASRLGTSVPRQAEAPESCPVPSTDQVS